MGSTQTATSPTTVFVLGLLSLVLCQLLGPVAWIMGNNYTAECMAEGLTPDGLGVAGRVLGIVGTVIMGLQLVLVGLYIAVIICALGAGGM